MATQILTTVRLLSGVPFNQNNTINFGSATAQQGFMTGKTTHAFSGLTYQREHRYFSAPDTYEHLIGCNYIAYQNASYGNKWFYAFIDRMEYINDERTDIYFTIDPWQTYLFDTQVKQCFVEREHVTDDTAGAHTLPEPVQTGPYVTQVTFKHTYSNWWIVVGSTVDLDEAGYPDAGITNMGGVYSGLGYFVFDNIPALQAILFDGLVAAGKLDAVKAMYMVPKAFYPGTSGEKMHGNPPAPIQDTVPRPTTLDGYTPRNNKLLTSPFMGLEVSNLNGQATSLAFELFASTITLETYGSPFPGGIILCYPQNYEGVEKNYDMGVTIGNYPIMAWTGDDFANWLAQQVPARAFQAAGTGLSTIGGVLTGGGVGAVAAGFGRLIEQQLSWGSETAQRQMLPNTFRGNAGGEITRINNNTYGFEVKTKTIRKEYAQMIDSYFDRFGYRVLTTKQPNISGRPSWNYVKTIGALITGNAPQSMLNEMMSTLDEGMTFWHGDWVGDYSRANK